MRSLLALLPYMRPHRRSLVLGLLFVVGASAFTSVIPWFVGRALDDIIRHAPLARILMRCVMLVAFAIIGGAFRYGMRECLNGVSRYVEYDMRNALFAH